MKVSLPTRHLIPRWRSTSRTLLEPEAQSLKQTESRRIISDQEELSIAIQEWRIAPTTGRLGHILAFSVSSEALEKVRAVANEALNSHSISLTPTQKHLIYTLLSKSDQDHDQEHTINDTSIFNPFVRKKIRVLRELLRDIPSNPHALLDIAQLQLSIGKSERAERFIRTALHLSPNSRVVLRTLARFLVHVERKDEAFHLISRHSRTPYDPWLMASEIAIAQSAELPSRFASKGWKIAREGSFRYSQISELAGAIAGLDLEHGKNRHARELFRIALIEPNDNVIAQAVTDQSELGFKWDSPAQGTRFEEASEARTLLAFNELDIDAVDLYAKRWHSEEPFSSRPLQFLSTVLSLQGRFEEADRFVRRGLIADPSSSHLLGLLAYLLAIRNVHLDQAERYAVRAAHINPRDMDAPATATLGLIAMQRGSINLGEELYLQSAAKFLSAKKYKLHALCHAYFARSAVLVGHRNAKDILAKAISLYNEHPSLDGALILRELYATNLADPKSKPLRRLSQWIYDSEDNILVRQMRVTGPGAPILVIKSPKTERRK